MQKQRKKSAVSQKIKITVPANVVEECRRLKQQKKGFTKYLYEKVNYNTEQINLVLEELKKGSLDKKSSSNVEDNVEWESSLKFTDKYIYNKQDDKYIMHLKSANGNIVLPGDTVRGIKENYSNWVGEEHSINQVCRNYQIPRNYLVEILKVLGITHDSEPVTDEQINERDVKDIAKDILQKKKFNLYQEFQKRSWKETEEDASKWRRLQEGVIDPFTNFISSWNPPPREKILYKGTAAGNKPRKSFVVGLSDVHFGAKSNPKDSYRNKGYSTQDAVNYIKKYVQEIKEAVESRNYHFDECVLAAMGDILHTTGAGYTTKGTMLVHDCIKSSSLAHSIALFC
jgi:hypothetical protein